ncbi:MAG: 4-oxalocrotonate tautomerase [Desulfuromonas sp.]|nr:MAG: 4-oxalocrotonate tautomerase [Desulfuromonas sp.]
MPVITIEGPPVEDIKQRRDMVEAITTAAARTYGMAKEKIIILIRENSPDQVAVGGELISDRN